MCKLGQLSLFQKPILILGARRQDHLSKDLIPMVKEMGSAFGSLSALAQDPGHLTSWYLAIAQSFANMGTHAF